MRKALVYLLVLLALSALLVGKAALEDGSRVRGLRLDPAFLYQTPHFSASPERVRSLARAIVDDASRMHVNTLFVRAYDSRYGAYYRTSYADVEVEGALGQAAILSHIVEASHTRGIAVVAWMPANNFRQAWLAHPGWRSKRQDGSDYRAGTGDFLLSAGHPEFLAWYEGLLRDLAARVPGLAGWDIAEGVVDVAWKDEADYNPAMLAAVRAPAGGEGLPWRAARAMGMTLLHRRFATTVHALHRQAFVTQTWATDADCQGQLLAAADLADHAGIDFDGILAAPRAEHPDAVVVELIWQQWRHTCGKEVFAPAWTRAGGAASMGIIGRRAATIIHVEATPFGPFAPTAGDLAASLAIINDLGAGLDVYDYHQILAQGLETVIANAYAPWWTRVKKALGMG